MLHFDIFYKISLHCEPYSLCVNKELSSLYKDSWFQDSLQTKYPDKKLYTQTNYKDLYIRYLSEGNIYFKIHKQEPVKLLIKGIKAQHFHGDLILTFNGELYHQINNEIILIDTEVIDLNSNVYIKENRCYKYLEDKTEEIKLDIKEKYKSVIYYYGVIFILTDLGLHQFIEHFNMLLFISNIIDIFHDKYIYIVDINEKNYIYHIESFIAVPISAMEIRTYKNTKWLCNKNLELPIITDKYLSDGKYILSKNNLYKYKQGNPIKLIDQDVLNFINSGNYCIYYIKS